MQRKKHKFSAISSPPKHNIKQKKYIKFLQTLDDSFNADGDFNVKHTGATNTLLQKAKSCRRSASL